MRYSRRRYRFRRRPYGRKRYRRRFYRRRRRSGRRELKLRYLLLSNSIGTAWTTVPAGDTGVAVNIWPGTSSNQRVGRKIYLKNFVIRGSLISGATGASGIDDSWDAVRIVILWGSPGTTIANRFDTSGLGLYSPIRNQDYVNRVLFDKVYTLRSLISLGGGNFVPAVKEIHINKRLNKTITFNDTDQYCLGRDLYVLMVSNSLAIPNPGWSESSYAKIQYYDA